MCSWRVAAGPVAGQPKCPPRTLLWRWWTGACGSLLPLPELCALFLRWVPRLWAACWSLGLPSPPPLFAAPGGGGWSGPLTFALPPLLSFFGRLLRERADRPHGALLHGFFCGVLLASRSFPFPCFGWACRWLLDTFNWFCFRVCGVSTWWGGLRGAVLACFGFSPPVVFSVRQLALFCLQCTLFLWTLVCSFVLDAASWCLCKHISLFTSA